MPVFGVDHCHNSCASQHRRIDELTATRQDVVKCSPDLLGGTPVSRGTRVPAKALLDDLAAGDSLQTFLDDFPSVGREQAIALMEIIASRSPA